MYREFAIGQTSGKAFRIRDDAAAVSGQGRQFTAFLSFLGRELGNLPEDDLKG
jgi:hypothetical protein